MFQNQPPMWAKRQRTGSSVMMASSPLPMPLCTNSLAQYLDGRMIGKYQQLFAAKHSPAWAPTSFVTAGTSVEHHCVENFH